MRCPSLKEIAALEKPHIVKNTELSSKWAMKNLTEWFLDYKNGIPICHAQKVFIHLHSVLLYDGDIFCTVYKECSDRSILKNRDLYIKYIDFTTSKR